jgi:small-conductance mechanosensitive channel
VENEWGKIEEITLTYIVVRIWDLRRLVLPITYFTQTPFQNWTRVTADLLGTAFLYVDYTTPVEAVREALHQILQKSPLWDQKVWGLQVTNASEKTVELRALMSAPDASTAWDLRCHVREELIRFIRLNYPDGFPRLRAEFSETPRSGPEAG